MAVIPNPPSTMQGTVIVWDKNDPSQNNPGMGSPWTQRFAVGNPETQPPVFTNYEIQIPLQQPGNVFWGDMFCSAHVWLPDGRLFVAGGNTRYEFGTSTHYEGSQLAALWDPNLVGNATRGWTFLAGMNKKRWYPTATLFLARNGDVCVMVSGGVQSTANDFCLNNNDQAFNTYEVWNATAGDWERVTPNAPPTVYDGPATIWGPCASVLGEYPRMHLTSTNQVFLGGMFTGGNRVCHRKRTTLPLPPQDWETQYIWGSSLFRHYGSSVLLPNVGNDPGGRDLIMILGGGKTNPPVAHSLSQIIDAGATNPAWSPTEPMTFPRMCANAVLLPNGEVLAIGGSLDYYFTSPSNATPAFDSEVYNKQTGWKVDDAQASPRMYHSTAALLPSGKVVSAGGDIRTSDYEVFTPSYLAANQTRPAFAGSWAGGSLTLAWNTEYSIEHAPLPVGVTISRVVFMRPCSVTHHSDFDQRYVELVRVATPKGQYNPPNTVRVRTPEAMATTNATGTGGDLPGSMEAPPGWYLGFLISSQGTPSLGKWVKL